MNSIDKKWIFTELKKATKDLTITTRKELDSVVGEAMLDELALDFGNFLGAATPYLQDTDLKGLELLKDIDKQLDRISGSHHASLWTEQAFLADQNWTDIRRRALVAIDHFDWS